MRSSLIFLLLAVSAPALADDWTAAVHAELELQDVDLAIARYGKVQRSGSPRAAEATRRKLLLLAGKGDWKAARAELDYLRTFPGPVDDMLEKLADPDRLPRITRPTWKRDYQRVLSSRKVTLNFPGTPLEEVVSFFRDITGLNIVIAPGVDRKQALTYRVRSASLEKGLRETLGKKLAWSLVHETLLIHKAGAAPARVTVSGSDLSGNEEVYRRMLTQRIDIHFRGTPINEAIDFLRDVTGLSFVVRKLDPRGTVRLRLKGVSLLQAIKLIVASQEAELGLSGGCVLVGKDLSALRQPPPAGRAKHARTWRILSTRVVDLNFPDTPLSEAVSFLRDVTGLKVELGQGVDATVNVRLRLKKVLLSRAIALMLGQAGLRYRLTGQGVVIERSGP